MNVPYLDAVLFLLGISREEIEEADDDDDRATPASTDGCRDTPADQRPRRLFIIGGAEDRVGKASLLRRFVRLAGGRTRPARRDPHRLVVPGRGRPTSYTEVFTRLGAPGGRRRQPARAGHEAHDPALVALVDEATGVFMSGGSQLKLSQMLPGTPLGDALHRAHERGAVIGGTSAGASIMSEFMISMGEEGMTPRQRRQPDQPPGSAWSRASSSTSTSTSGHATVG